MIVSPVGPWRRVSIWLANGPVSARYTSGSGEAATGVGAGVGSADGAGADSAADADGAGAEGIGVALVATKEPEGVGLASPICGSGDPFRRTIASSAPATTAKPPPTPAKRVAGRRHHGRPTREPPSMPVRTRALRSAGTGTCRSPATIWRWSEKAATVARQSAHPGR